jgi:hypothetical protein
MQLTMNPSRVPPSFTAFALMSVSLLGACAVADSTDPTDPQTDPTTGEVGNDGVAADSPDEPIVAGPVESTVHLIGRFEYAGTTGPAFAWPGSAIWTRFAGTSLEMQLSGSAHFDVEIDGVLQPVLVTEEGVATYVVASNLADGEHDLRVTRRTEAYLGVTRFIGFKGARLIATPAPTRLIEMIGEGATAGRGVLGSSGTCAFSPETESETLAWGALAARDLGAAHTALAYGGRGVTRNYGGSTFELAPSLFERTLPDDPDSLWTFTTEPDVVVMNVGAADFWRDDVGREFIDEYQSFIHQVRSHYQDAWILVVPSAEIRGATHDLQVEYLEQVVANETAFGNSKIALIELPDPIASDGFGCGYMPSQATQRRNADVLKDAIKERVTW